MYEELIKQLRNCASGTIENCTGCPYQGGYKGTYCMSGILSEAANAIEILLGKGINVPRWISVAEGLPEAGEIVLVYGKRGGIYTAEHNRNGMWPGVFWKLNSKNHHCEPTHWMPLPPPPMEVDG